MTDDPRPNIDWRALAYTINGYELWGSFERCAEVGNRVLDAVRERRPMTAFTTNELHTALFFSARAERHADQYSDSVQEAVIVRAIVERMGAEWCRAEIARGSDADRKTRENAALGALLGAVCGDAAGSVLEFIGRPPTAAEVEHALRMPGGGVLRVAPGQVTDDGELMICLARGLAGGVEPDLERVAVEYAAWYRSAPFDMGNTTRQSIGSVDRRPEARQGLASVMRTAAAAHCAGSKANGSLMRAAPLGVFGYGRSPEEIVQIARADSSLTHPHPSCCDAVACYALAIAHLVDAPGDRGGAFQRAEVWARDNADREIVAWLDDASTGRLPPAHPLPGFVRIAFTHAFAHLRCGSHYEEALRAVLALGGDSDTNACIVGGLIGAADGAEAIPEAMRMSVLTCRTGDGHVRPEFLHPRQLPELARILIGLAPRR